MKRTCDYIVKRKSVNIMPCIVIRFQNSSCTDTGFQTIQLNAADWTVFVVQEPSYCFSNVQMTFVFMLINSTTIYLLCHLLFPGDSAFSTMLSNKLCLPANQFLHQYPASTISSSVSSIISLFSSSSSLSSTPTSFSSNSTLHSPSSFSCLSFLC